MELGSGTAWSGSRVAELGRLFTWDCSISFVLVNLVKPDCREVGTMYIDALDLFVNTHPAIHYLQTILACLDLCLCVFQYSERINLRVSQPYFPSHVTDLFRLLFQSVIIFSPTEMSLLSLPSESGSHIRAMPEVAVRSRVALITWKDGTRGYSDFHSRSPVGWLVGWLVGRLVGWLVGWLIGWLVGWFIS